MNTNHAKARLATAALLAFTAVRIAFGYVTPTVVANKDNGDTVVFPPVEVKYGDVSIKNGDGTERVIKAVQKEDLNDAESRKRIEEFIGGEIPEGFKGAVRYTVIPESAMSSFEWRGETVKHWGNVRTVVSKKGVSFIVGGHKVKRAGKDVPTESMIYFPRRFKIRTNGAISEDNGKMVSSVLEMPSGTYTVRIGVDDENCIIAPVEDGKQKLFTLGGKDTFRFLVTDWL